MLRIRGVLDTLDFGVTWRDEDMGEEGWGEQAVGQSWKD